MHKEKEADTVKGRGGQIGLVGWPESGQSMPSMMANFCVILTRLWCFIVWSNTILDVVVISI